ncbi:MAG TPA: hypothetical protein ENJ95_14040 [Bacteroidetes bacterium]|nr:hypothetical protein [Bacteroidota bacterium]
MKILSIIFSLFILGQAAVTAQGYDANTNYDTIDAEKRKEISQLAIRALKDGVLIVRLKTGSKQVAALQKLANGKNVSADERERFEKKAAKWQVEKRLKNQWLMEAFRKKYSFSDVLYMPDTSTQQLKNGVQSGYFLNAEMEVDPSISLDGRPYLVAYYGSSFSSQKTGAEGIVVLDNNLKELPAPFPHFVGMATIKKVFKRLFNKVEEGELYVELLEKFNKKVKGFYKDFN